MKLFKKNEKKVKRATTKKLAMGYTIMIIPDSTDAPKTTEITIDQLVKLFAGAIAAAIIVIGLIASMIYHNYTLKKSLNESKASIEELADINARLGETISSLNDQVIEDQRAFNKIQATIDEQEQIADQAAVEAAIPSAMPIKGNGAVAVEDPYDSIEEGASTGIVFSAIAGTIVVATGSGVVESIEPDVAYMNRITVNHENGYKTLYRIPCEASVSVGNYLSRNDMLASLGQDGFVAYEIVYNGEVIDPQQVIAFK